VRSEEEGGGPLASDGRRRREFLIASSGLALAAYLRGAHAADAPPGNPGVLEAAAGRQQLAPVQYPQTDVWAFNGVTPGPTLRLRQGERLRVVLANRLPQQGTTIHWHGVRLPNAMDGVPDLTQPPVMPEPTTTKMA